MTIGQTIIYKTQHRKLQAHGILKKLQNWKTEQI